MYIPLPKRHTLSEWLRKHNPSFMLPKGTVPVSNMHYLRGNGWKGDSKQNGTIKQANIGLLRPDK